MAISNYDLCIYVLRVCWWWGCEISYHIIRVFLWQACVDGTFSSSAGSVGCTPCPAGYSCTQAGGTVTPAACGSGQYSLNGTDCAACPAGMYCPSSDVEPIPCADGQYNDQEGMTPRYHIVNKKTYSFSKQQNNLIFLVWCARSLVSIMYTYHPSPGIEGWYC